MDEHTLHDIPAYEAGTYQVIVVGAGHAGIEAALACARLGLATLCFTINLDAVGNMPCNPAIGGTGKGHLVRELDALGGEMAKAADRACIQYRMLNRGKGPAVWSLRAQADRRLYQQVMKHALERQEGLTLRQGEVVDIRLRDGAVHQVVLHTGAVYTVRAAIVCSGTYLSGRTIVGECVREGGPWPSACGSWAWGSAGSRPARPHGSTPGRWIFPKWSSRRGTPTPCPSPSRPGKSR